MDVDLGHRLAMVRHARRISQIELARRVEITQKHLSQIETGARPLLRLACETIVRLARALHVSTDYLLGVKDDDENLLEPAAVELVGA